MFSSIDKSTFARLAALTLLTAALLAPDIAAAQSKVTPNEPRSGSNRSQKSPPTLPQEEEPQAEPEAEAPALDANTPPQNALRESMSGPELIRLLEELGVVTVLTEDDYGDPYVEARFSDMDFFIVSYDCDQARTRQCGSFMFRVAFATGGSVNSDFMNDWNYNKRWTRAYMDDEFDPVLEMDMAFYGGLPDTAVAERVRLWLESLSEFYDYVGY